MINYTNDIIEQWNNNVCEYPDHIILKDSAHPKGMTFKEVDILSGQVYAFLCSKKISKEDIVLISLPRGIESIIAMLGILKAGAAFILSESTYPPERIAFMVSNCNPKLILDSALWEKILAFPYLAGNVDADCHDAAFIVYTSGSTGNPKGVLHERGKFPLIVQSLDIELIPDLGLSDRFALNIPLNFVAAIYFITCMLYHAVTINVIDMNIVKNPLLLKKYFLDEKITCTFLVPSAVRMLKDQLSSYLKLIVSGGENANNLYLPNVTLLHQYAMSESAFAITNFVIKEPLERCPIGKPSICTSICSENDELVFKNPYTRGYVNLEQITCEKFRDGFFYTGDVVHSLADGNYVLDGRLDDMIKINGNRIEPFEIEAAFQKCTGITQCLAKGFLTSKRTYVCLFYQNDIEIDSANTRIFMSQLLPEYMIPARFIRMDNLPKNQNGKLSRLLLTEPQITENKSSRDLPRNTIESKLYSAMCKVLDLDNLGIYDDFYELGGDSYTTIQLVVESGLYSLNARDIFVNRTIAKISEKYIQTIENFSGNDYLKSMNEKAKHSQQPLTEEQKYIFDYQLYTPKSTMYVLPILLRLKEDVNIETLVNAINATISAHLIFKTVIKFNTKGELYQKYTENSEPHISYETYSYLEWQTAKNNLTKPYEKLIDKPLYKFKIIETPGATYLYFDIHHIFCDGTSFNTILQDIAKAYQGETIPSDYYFFYLEQKKNEKKLETYKSSKKYFESTYDTKKWEKHIPADFNTRDNNNNTIIQDLDISIPNNINPNVFFIASALISLAYCVNNNSVCVSWVYNGRDEAYKQNTAGLLFRILPAAITFNKNMSVFELFENITNQVNLGIANATYPYIIKNAPIVTGDYFCVLFQGNMRNLPKELFAIANEEIPLSPIASASQSLLDIEILSKNENKYIGLFDYNSSIYKKESMQHFINIFHKTCHILSNKYYQNISYSDLFSLINS